MISLNQKKDVSSLFPPCLSVKCELKPLDVPGRFSRGLLCNGCPNVDSGAGKKDDFSGEDC